MLSSHHKYGIVLLAAGNSQRFGSLKLTADIHGKPMFEYALKLYDCIPVACKIIVTQYEEIFYKAREMGFRAVLNEYPEMGISKSIGMGIVEAKKLMPDLEALMFGVCDQPYLSVETIEHLWQMLEENEAGIICPKAGEQLGNPVIFRQKYFEELALLTGDVGGKRVLRKHLDDVFYLNIENLQELKDIDYPRDLL